MNSENSKKINLKNIVLGTIVGGMLIAGTYALDTKYKIIDRTKEHSLKIYDHVVDIFTTDIEEAQQKLIVKIKENQETGEEYDLGKLVNEINSYREQKEVVNDAINIIDNSKSYSEDISKILKKADKQQKQDITDNYLNSLRQDDGSVDFVAYKVVEKLEGKSLNLIANKTYKRLENNEKRDFLEQNINQMPESTQILLINSMSKNFSQEAYEFLIPNLYEKTIEKYDNRFTVTKSLFRREKETLNNFLDRVYDFGSKIIEEGSKKLESYNSNKL
jgi:hypothetical protein